MACYTYFPAAIHNVPDGAEVRRDIAPIPEADGFKVLRSEDQPTEPVEDGHEVIGT